MGHSEHRKDAYRAFVERYGKEPSAFAIRVKPDARKMILGALNVRCSVPADRLILSVHLTNRRAAEVEE